MDGVFGKAFGFREVESRVALGNSALFNSQEFTFSAWIRRSSLERTSLSNPGSGVLFAGGTGAYAIALLDSGVLYFSIVGAQIYSSGAGITDLLWHHVAVRRNGGNVSFFIDGVEVSQAVVPVEIIGTGPFEGAGFRQPVSGRSGC